MGWLQGWIKDAPDDNDIMLSIYILWNIWLARNKFVWEGRDFNLEKLLNAMDAMYQVKLPWQEENNYQCSPEPHHQRSKSLLGSYHSMKGMQFINLPK